MPIRFFCAGALVMTLASFPVPAHADSPFEDPACPQANSSGRKLNELNASGKASNDEMFAASQGLVDAYRDCVSTSDQALRSKNNDGQSTDYIVVHRSYARLQLARAYQRMGSLHEQVHEFVPARAFYEHVSPIVSEIEAIIGSPDISSAGNEGKLLAEARQLRTDVAASLAKLPVAPTASASPS